MKDKIYSEIERLENSNNDFNKNKGQVVRLAAETIHCFKCIDTKRCWHDRYNLPWSAMDGRGNYDIDGCPNCNNIGWISCSHSNYNEENGVSIYHKDDNECWDLRFEQLYKKGLVIEQTIKKIKEPECKPEGKALFEVNKRITRHHIEKTIELDVEVGKIVNIVKESVEAYFGNVFSLVDLCKELKVSFTISESESSTSDKLIKIKDNNYLGIKTSVITTKNKIKTGLFEKNKYAKEYTADIFILKPLNEEAIEKSKLIMSKISEDMINDILKEF